MNETIEQIEANIKGKYDALRSSFDELENKVKAAGDWRGLFARHPGKMMAAAFGAGAVLAVLSRRRRRGRGQAVSRGEPDASAKPIASSGHRHNGVARQIWDPVKDVVIGVAVMRSIGFLEQLLAGAREEPKDKDSARSGSLPES